MHLTFLTRLTGRKRPNDLHVKILARSVLVIHACVMNNWHMLYLRLKICSIQHTRKRWVLYPWGRANGTDLSCDFKKLKNSVVENIPTGSHIQYFGLDKKDVA